LGSVKEQLATTHPYDPRPPRKKQILTTRMGLRIPAGLPFETWQEAGPKLFRIIDSSAWYLGDWLVYGQDRYEKRYRRAIEAAGLDYQTLRNYAWVARKFELSRRREPLSFQHHAEVASLAPADQDLWLDRAEALGWSRNQLRKELRASRNLGPAAPTQLAAVPDLQVTEARLEQWQRAAGGFGEVLTNWIVNTLDRAAFETLDDGDLTPADYSDAN
jgi:hypothetical protein